MSTVTFTATDQSGLTGSATCTVDFILGETKPVASNTGLAVEGLTFADLTVVNGDLNINDAWVASNGNSFNKLWIKGHIYFTATVPVYGNNSRVQGRTFTTVGSPPRTALVYARSTSTPATAKLHLENCEIDPIQPDVNIVCTSGEKIGSLKRCILARGSDGGNWWNSSMVMEGCYIHSYSFWTTDTKHSGDGFWPNASHNDGCQSNGGPVSIVGCNFDMRADSSSGNYSALVSSASPGGGFPEGAYGSGVMLSGSNGYFTGHVRDCWFGYGRNPIMMPMQSGGNFNNGGSVVEFSDNKFYALPRGYGSTHNARNLISWGYTMGTVTCFNNSFTHDLTIPEALRGTQLPPAVLQGNQDINGQMVVRVLFTPTEVFP
jgi:hypothetical protein